MKRKLPERGQKYLFDSRDSRANSSPKRPFPPNRRPPKRNKQGGCILPLFFGIIGIALVVGMGFVVWYTFSSNSSPEVSTYVAQNTSDISPSVTSISGSVVVEPETIPSSPLTQDSTPFAVAKEIVISTPVASDFILPNEAQLQQQMYALINQDRAANGLSQLSWDETAGFAGRLHSEDMVQNNYFSHWNQEGLGPEHRYALVGGEDVVMENLHAFSYTYDDGSGAPIEDWQEVIQNAQIGLMNSPGHRANILDPAHTHVGIGMAYNPDTGQFRLAQEFTNQYVDLDQRIPVQAELGDEILVNGRLSPATINNILLDLAYEPFPEPMSREELNQTSTYTSRAESLDTIAIPAVFNETIAIDVSGDPGFYHIRIFGDLDTRQALLMDRVIVVR